MSLIFATQLTAAATAILAVFAIVTAVFAFLAFRKQSQEVDAIERQVRDQQELTRQQAGLLKIQSGQVELQREQLDDQRKANAEQAEVFKLQADELRESLSERKRETEQRRRAQASRVFIWEEHGEDEVNFPAGSPPAPWVAAYVMNTSQLPVYNVIISWHLGHRPEGRRHLPPLMPGAEEKDTRSVPPDTDPAIFGAVAFFRDTAGVTWRTLPDGQLEEIPPGQEPPHTW